jgi:hypothetical protein
MEEIEILEIVEVELYASKGEPLPRAHKYVVRLDGKKFTLHKHQVTGAEILALDGMTPAKFKLYEHRHREQPRLGSPPRRDSGARRLNMPTPGNMIFPGLEPPN